MTPVLPIALLGLALCMLCMQIANIAMQMRNRTGTNVPEPPTIPPMPRKVKRTDWNRILEVTKL